jgi:HK97 family phage portal protein
MGGLIRRISNAIKAFRSFEDYDEKKWQDWVRGPLTKAGTRVNEVSSLNISAVYAAVNFIASTIASLPKVIFRRIPSGGRVKAYEHPLYDRLHNKPNGSNMTAWQWIYTQLIHKYLWGNWYTYLDFKSHQNRGLIPLLPDRTYQDPTDDSVYITHKKDGTQLRFPDSQILHIPHFSLDGVKGKGVVHYARESLGITKALDEYAGHFFGNGTHQGGFVEIQGVMDDETRKGLQADFNEKYRGLGEAWKVIFLTGDAKFKPNEIDLARSQALESRQFSVLEVSRWLNLPPHVLRELTHATFSNIEEQALELVIYSLMPITTQIEQAMNIAFFDDEEREKHYVKFELKGLLRGDLKARTEFYNAMLDRGVFNADMVLDLEDMNPQPDGLGQLYILPLNMVNKKLVVSPQPLTIEAPRGAPETKRQTVQIVERRSGALRRKITIAYKKQFDSYGEKIIAEEVNAVRKAAKETLGARNMVDFLAWLDEFYPEFSKTIDTLAAPLLTSYSDAILPVALEEIASEANISAQYQAFQREYREYFVDRHVKSSTGQLKSIVSNAQENDEDIAEVVEQRLTEWEEKRGAKITMRESIRAESAFTRAAFAGAGISKIRSVSYGKSCPYCLALDGKIIGIDEYFLTKGEFQPDGADEPLIVTGNCSHPPYHDGCDCGIDAGI